MLTIPLINGQNQTLQTIINRQVLTIRLYMLGGNLFMDLLLNGIAVKYGQLCLDRVLMFDDVYIGFTGALMFEDTAGDENPLISGLGERYKLRYLERGVDF